MLASEIETSIPVIALFFAIHWLICLNRLEKAKHQKELKDDYPVRY